MGQTPEAAWTVSRRGHANLVRQFHQHIVALGSGNSDACLTKGSLFLSKPNLRVVQQNWGNFMSAMAMTPVVWPLADTAVTVALADPAATWETCN
jgi:hypothetical protein